MSANDSQGGSGHSPHFRFTPEMGYDANFLLACHEGKAEPLRVITIEDANRILDAEREKIGLLRNPVAPDGAPAECPRCFTQGMFEQACSECGRGKNE